MAKNTSILLGDYFDNFIDKLSDDHNILVIEENNKIVGCVTYFIEYKMIRGGCKVLHVEDLIVDELCRKRGFGKDMLIYLINYAKNIGCYKIILNCSENLENFYVNCGFNKKNLQMCKYF